MKMTDCN